MRVPARYNALHHALNQVFRQDQRLAVNLHQRIVELRRQRDSAVGRQEYYDKTSPSIDVAFHAVDKAAVLAKFGVADVNGPVSLVIWTLCR
jgi:isoleucyl-tRNA synthetase